MKRRNIAAFTPPGASYPPYVVINDTGEGVEITVRSPAKTDGRCGNCATIKLSRTEFSMLMHELFESNQETET